MGLFRRRRRGRHEALALRGTVVAPLPSAPPPWEALPAAVPQQPPYGGPGPVRVELGFRDGSTAALAPESAQARALLALADVLTHRS